jgi:DNA-binding transcriptional regulator YhcF (GntR family)
MEWQINNNAPIYSQLVEHFKRAIASGEFAPGEKLPPVRELAVSAGVNPNTMQRALAELERDGLVYTQRTSGRFVTEDDERIGKAKNELAFGMLNSFLSTMEQLGYTRSEIIEMIKEEEKDGNT